MSESLIEVRGLSKRFGSVLAVDEVSFSVARGEVLGFLGPNGAGKSTTMKVVTGFLPPTAGTAVVCGHDVRTDPFGVHASIGYLPEGAPLYGDMTPEAFLGFIATVRGLSGRDRRKRIDDVIRRLELGEVLYRKIDALSKGFKRRVGLAQAILHDPDVLLLDEPTDGLDPNQKRHVRDLIREMSKKKAIIISTHILEEVDAVCDRAIIIDRGRIVSGGTPAELHARAPNHNAVVLRLKNGAAEPLAKALRELPNIRAVLSAGRPGGETELTVLPRGGEFIADRVGVLVRQQGAEVTEMRTERGHLDDVFHDVTTKH